MCICTIWVFWCVWIEYCVISSKPWHGLAVPANLQQLLPYQFYKHSAYSCQYRTQRVMHAQFVCVCVVCRDAINVCICVANSDIVIPFYNILCVSTHLEECHCLQFLSRQSNNNNFEQKRGLRIAALHTKCIQHVAISYCRKLSHSNLFTCQLDL